MPTIEERVQRMERSTRRWRNLALGLTLVLIGISTVAAREGSGTQDHIRARSIVLVNENGQTALTATADSWGGTLKLYDTQGDGSGKEGFSATPGRMTVSNRDNGKLIFYVEQSGNQDGRGDGLMGLMTVDERPILQIGQSGGNGFMQLHNKDGKNTMYGPAWR